MVPNITYASIFGYIGYSIAEFYPSSEYCNHFIALSPLPSGLFIDPATGVIGGTPTCLFNGTISISALFLGSILLNTSVFIRISNCEADHSIIKINVYSESYSNDEHLLLYQGRDKTELLWEFTCPTSSQYDYAFTFCLKPAIYTFVAKSIDNNGWLFPAGYSISLQEEEIIVSIRHVRNASEQSQSVFTALNPFPPHASCTYLVDEQPPSGWTLLHFDDSEWNEGLIDALPSMISKQMNVRILVNIPSLFDYRVLGITIRYSTCFIAYFNGNRVARAGLPETPHFGEFCSSSPSSLQSLTFYVLIMETGGVVGFNTLAFEIHQLSSNSAVTFKTTGYFGVDDVNEMFNLFDENTITNPLLDSNIMSYRQVDGKIGNRFGLELKNLEGQPFNAISYYCDQQIPKYTLLLFATSPFSSQTPHPFYQEGMELLLVEETTGIQDRLKSVLPIPYAMGRFRRLQLIDMYYQLKKDYLLFSGILPSYSFVNTMVVCPSLPNYHSVKNGEIAPGPCPVNQTGVSTRRCIDGVFEKVDYSLCTFIPPANITYPSTLYSFFVGIPASTGSPTYEYSIEAFYTETPLPLGLSIKPATGEIVGTPQAAVIKGWYTVVGQNKDGSDRTALQIEVTQLSCLIEEDQSVLLLFADDWVGCSMYGRGIGRVHRQCVYADQTPKLELTFYCIYFSRFGICILSVVVILLLCLLLRWIRQRMMIRRIFQISDSLYKYAKVPI